MISIMVQNLGKMKLKEVKKEKGQVLKSNKDEISRGRFESEEQKNAIKNT